MGGLVAVCALDELWSAVPAVAAPTIRRSLGLSHAELSLLTLTLPFAVAAVVEPPLLLLLQARFGYDALRRQGLAALALACGCAALSTRGWTLALALSVAFVASGVALAAAQAALMDAAPARRTEWMTRWTLAGELGDLCAPALVAACGGFLGGYRGAFGVCAGLLLAMALLPAAGACSAGAARGGPGVAAPPRPPFRAALQTLARDRSLRGWLLGGVLCALLDELLVICAAIRMREQLEWSAQVSAWVLMAGSAGAALGLLTVEALLRRMGDLRLLVASCVACIVAFAAFCLADQPWTAALSLALVGATAAPHYPIVQARAYAAVPGRALWVASLESLTHPLQLSLPYLVGLIADRHGILTASWCLLLQPAGLLLLVAVLRAGDPDRRPGAE